MSITAADVVQSRSGGEAAPVTEHAARPRNRTRRTAGSGRSLLLRLARKTLRLLLGTRGGRVLVLLLLLAALGWWAWDGYMRPRHPDGPSVRIATWNLRQFSASRADLDYEAIAAIIEREGFHLLAMQEVKGDGGAVGKLVDELNGPLAISGRWRVLLGPPTGNAERFAFIYDSEAVRSLGPIDLPHAAMLRMDRTPFAGRFRSGNFDFTLVNVHLFFGDTQRRYGEAAQLALLLDDRQLPAVEGDVMIVGDFNTTTSRAPGSLGPFIEGGWTAINQRPTNLADRHRLDNLLIRPRPTREWTGRTGVIDLPADADTARGISDHQPVWADFVVTLEDDD